MVETRTFLCECGYRWFKIHNLMLSDQNEIKLYINNQRKLLGLTICKCHFIAYKKTEC